MRCILIQIDLLGTDIVPISTVKRPKTLSGKILVLTPIPEMLLNGDTVCENDDTPLKITTEESSINGVTTKKATLAGLNALDIKITRTQNPRPIPSFGSIEMRSQKVCSDHMASALWTEEHGWARPEILPYGPLAIMPTANVLHYATECFEGMKLYRGFDGALRLFRPYDNCLRMVQSAQRISLPAFDPEQLLQIIRKLCSIDGPRWLPPDRAGEFLYIRPAMIGTDSCLGFELPKEALLFVVLSYWPEPTKPSLGKGLRLFASPADEVRAWPGGTGSAKIGANYGPALKTHGEARRRGYDQVLWLYGPQGQITEAGSSNVFVIWRCPGDGVLELVTAPLNDKIILAGITRQSVIDLAEEKLAAAQEFVIEGSELQRVEPLRVLEKVFTVDDLTMSLAEARFVSLFIVGTAASVTEVSEINFGGRGIHLGATGDNVYVSLLRTWLRDIMYGKTRHKWAMIVEEH